MPRSRRKQTILPYLTSEQKTLDYAVQKTYFPGIDLIPACLALYEAEITIVMRVAGQSETGAAAGVLPGAEVRDPERRGSATT